MTFKTYLAGGCVAAVAFAAGSSAMAQAAAPAAAGPAIAQGPAIPGVCVMDLQGATGSSTVGRFVINRLQQIQSQAGADLQTERASIEAEAKQLDAQKGTLDQNTLEQRAASLQVKDNAWQRKYQLRQRELEATEQKALNRVVTEMQPLIAQAYQAAHCSILIRREAVMTSNGAMDISPQVVTALNGKIQQFAFDRERLDGAGGAQAAGSAPIIQTPSAARPPAKK